MIGYIFQYKKKRLPIITILLVISCLITTIPQFFLSDTYNFITGSMYSQNIVYFTLPNFSHTPNILLPHLIGNLVVFLFFGSVIEVLIGSSRFALISIVTLITSVFLNYFRGADISHGVSGICWGYHIFVLFVLIVYWERKRLSIFKDVFVYIFIIIFFFDFFMIPGMEVFVMKMRFAENFGQYIHLVSNIIVVPFLFLWRKEIELNFNTIIDKKQIAIKKNKLVPIIVICLLLVWNLVVTISAIITAIKYEQPTYSISPPVGTTIDKLGDTIIIDFDREMEINSEKEISHSIHYNSLTVPQYKVYWKDNKRLEVHFSRLFEKEEYVIIDFTIKQESFPIRVPLHIEYK